MTDKELLELAAKAVGIELSEGDHGDMLRVYFTDPHNGLRRYTVWNPLTDDGDALRLAVKIGIAVIQGVAAVEARHETHPPVLEFKAVELCEPDAYTATRRAIVCVAAEIGKEMGITE